MPELLINADNTGYRLIGKVRNEEQLVASQIVGSIHEIITISLDKAFANDLWTVAAHMFA